jgi:hypothetical protein
VSSPGPTCDQIAAFAQYLHVRNGRNEGNEVDNWLRAEELLRNQPANAFPATENGINHHARPPFPLWRRRVIE